MITAFELLLVDIHVLIRLILIALITVPFPFSFPLPSLVFEVGDLPILVDVEHFLEPHHLLGDLGLARPSR